MTQKCFFLVPILAKKKKRKKNLFTSIGSNIYIYQLNVVILIYTTYTHICYVCDTPRLM